MPHHFEFDYEHRILLIVMEGDIDGQEIWEIDKNMRERIVRMKPGAGISDLSGVAAFNVPSHIMRSAALQDPPFPADTPRFIVAPTDLLFGMSRMYELVANRPAGRLQVVRSRAEALNAIGAQNPKFEILE